MSTEPAENECSSQRAPVMDGDLTPFAEFLYEKFRQPPAADVAPCSPPQDPDKPLASLPYLPDFHVTIRPHKITEKEQPRKSLEPEYLKTVAHSKAVVNNPSQFSYPDSGHGDAELAELAVTASISVGTTRVVQKVACILTPCQKDGEKVPQPFQAVAKIYDPLYYSFKHSIGRYARDTVHQADKDYVNEAAAYEHLRKHGITGPFAPKYYGSWIFKLPITISGKSQSRSIQMVLMEALNGVSIQDMRVQNSSDSSGEADSFHYCTGRMHFQTTIGLLEVNGYFAFNGGITGSGLVVEGFQHLPVQYPEEYRLEVLARAMDGYVRQLKIGLDQRDFTGRNVTLVASSPEAPGEDNVGDLVLPRVVLVDYNIANAVEMPHEQANWLPANPAAVFWNEYLWHDFGGWVPNEWRDSAGLVDAEIQRR